MTSSTEVNQKAGRRAKVVIIDDEELLAELLSQWIERDHDVTTFTDPRAALDAIRKMDRCDVIFCDLMMPGVTGMDIHAQLVNDGRGWDKRMVFITGGAFTPQTAEFLNRVPNLRLEKPFEMSVVSNVIQMLLDQE
jgi:CheY-like chemotaxis protein